MAGSEEGSLGYSRSSSSKIEASRITRASTSWTIVIVLLAALEVIHIALLSARAAQVAVSLRHADSATRYARDDVEGWWGATSISESSLISQTLFPKSWQREMKWDSSTYYKLLCFRASLIAILRRFQSSSDSNRSSVKTNVQ